MASKSIEEYINNELKDIIADMKMLKKAMEKEEDNSKLKQDYFELWDKYLALYAKNQDKIKKSLGAAYPFYENDTEKLIMLEGSLDKKEKLSKKVECRILAYYDYDKSVLTKDDVLNINSDIEANDCYHAFKDMFPSFKIYNPSFLKTDLFAFFFDHRKDIDFEAKIDNKMKQRLVQDAFSMVYETYGIEGLNKALEYNILDDIRVTMIDNVILPYSKRVLDVIKESPLDSIASDLKPLAFKNPSQIYKENNYCMLHIEDDLTNEKIKQLTY